MTNRTELNLEEVEMICGGAKATIEDVREEVGDDKVALFFVNMFEGVHKVLNSFGIKHEYNIDVEKNKGFSMSM